MLSGGKPGGEEIRIFSPECFARFVDGFEPSIPVGPAEQVGWRLAERFKVRPGQNAFAPEPTLRLLSHPRQVEEGVFQWSGGILHHNGRLVQSGSSSGRGSLMIQTNMVARSVAQPVSRCEPSRRSAPCVAFGAVRRDHSAPPGRAPKLAPESASLGLVRPSCAGQARRPRRRSCPCPTPSGYTRPGGPEVMHYEEVTVGAPGPGESPYPSCGRRTQLHRRLLPDGALPVAGPALLAGHGGRGGGRGPRRRGRRSRGR